MKENNPVNELSFEDALKKLETIVEQLERGDVPLEESIRMYEQGAALKAHCDRTLKAAQLRIDQIVLDKDGTAKAEPADIDG